MSELIYEPAVLKGLRVRSRFRANVTRNRSQDEPMEGVSASPTISALLKNRVAAAATVIGGAFVERPVVVVEHEVFAFISDNV